MTEKVHVEGLSRLLIRALGAFSQPLDLQLLCSFEKGRKLLLGYIYLTHYHITKNMGPLNTSPAYINSKMAVR